MNFGKETVTTVTTHTETRVVLTREQIESLVLEACGMKGTGAKVLFDIQTHPDDYDIQELCGCHVLLEGQSTVVCGPESSVFSTSPTEGVEE